MWVLRGEPGFIGKTRWTLDTQGEPDPDLLVITFRPLYGPQRPTFYGFASFMGRYIVENGITWLAPAHLAWLVDLDGLRQQAPEVGTLPWLRGKIHLEPDFLVIEPKPSVPGGALGNFSINVTLKIPKPAGAQDAAAAASNVV